MKRLNPRERKLIAVGILVALVAVVWLVGILPIVGGFAERAAERERLLDTYQRSQRTLDAIPVWRAEIDQQRRSAAGFEIVAPTEALAADNLRDRVSRTFTAQGGEVKSVQDLSGEARKGFVRVRADLRLTQSQLNAGLSRLENEQPHVVVDYFAVAAERAFETGRPGPVDVRIDVSARYRGPRAR